MKTAFRGVICLLVLLAIGCQQETSVTSNTTIVEGPLGQRLDSILTPYVRQLREQTDNTAGLAIGVTQGRDVVYARTFGYANLDKEIPADLNTVFHIASVSKPFTALAIAKLVEQGKVRLDDRLVDHVPEFSMQSEGYADITLQHVLTHTSGIPRHLSTGDWENPVLGPEALEQLLADARDATLDFEPGTQYSYSNSGYDMLALVVDRVAGMPFADYVTQHILRPAGMTSSHYRMPGDSLPDHWAAPYSYGVTTQEWSPYPYAEKYFPSSGLQTSLMDMCRWGMLYINGDESVIGKEYLDLVTTAHYDTPWGDQIGLSWFLQSYLERPIIMHQGNDTGFESLVYIYPEEAISIVVMANRDFARTARIMNATSETIFADQPKDYSVSAKYLFAKAYREKGLEHAKEVWEALRSDTTDIYTTNDGDILTTGAVLENGGKWSETREILEYYLTINDQSTYAWRLLGNATLHLGDTIGAIACYERTLAINPDYEPGKVALAGVK